MSQVETSQVATSQVETNAYQCPVCDYVYDEAKGEAREGFPPGTPWEQVPDDWCCPDCAVREKPDFEKFGQIS